MPRLKKQRSLIIEKAEARKASLLSISDKLDFGMGLTSKAYDQLLTRARQSQQQYNTLLSQIDEAHNNFQVLERELADMSERMLTGIATHYGKDSSEYEKAGGTRKSERKRRKQRSPKATAAATAS